MTIRVTATVEGAELELAAGDEDEAASDNERGRRQAWLDGSEVELEVWRGSPPAGAEIEGPAVIELAESTVLLPAHWSGAVHPSGTIQLQREPG